MNEQQLVVVAGQGRNVPGRIATLLLPFDIEITAMGFIRDRHTGGWLVHLTVRAVADNAVKLLVKRLNRLVDVHRVVHLEPSSHLRQSVCVTLRPTPTDLAHIRELGRWFGAETLEVDKDGIMMHLNAAPNRCEAFVSALRPYRLVEVIPGALCGVRAGTRSTIGLPQRQNFGSAHPLVTSLEKRAQ